MVENSYVGGFGDYRSSVPGQVDYASAYGLSSVDFEERVNMERLRKGRLERAKSKLFKEKGLGVLRRFQEAIGDCAS